jgi:hypothetical protein
MCSPFAIGAGQSVHQQQAESSSSATLAESKPVDGFRAGAGAARVQHL